MRLRTTLDAHVRRCGICYRPGHTADRCPMQIGRLVATIRRERDKDLVALRAEVESLREQVTIKESSTALRTYKEMA